MADTGQRQRQMICSSTGRLTLCANGCMYQPIFSMLGVYQALISGFQDFVFWGQVVLGAFVLFFVPFSVAAAATGNLHLLIAAEVAYTTAVLACMYGKIHFWQVPGHMRVVEEREALEMLAVHGRDDTGAASANACSGEGVRVVSRNGDSAGVDGPLASPLGSKDGIHGLGSIAPDNRESACHTAAP